MDGTMIKIGIEQTQIVVGNDPPELDLFAAKELQRYLTQQVENKYQRLV